MLYRELSSSWLRKSQIAIHYAYWLCDRRPDLAIFWVHASSVDRFREAYQQIADELTIPGTSDISSDLLAIVCHWLKAKLKTPWLMIIDNADEMDMFSAEPTALNLARYIPDCPHGAILVTTRNKQVGIRVTRGRGLVEVPSMDLRDCEQLISQIIPGSDIGSNEMRKLVETMDYLPLAISQAAAFMQENFISIAEYLEIYASEEKLLVERLSYSFSSEGRDDDLPSAVATTWIISFDRVRATNPRAADLMSLMAFLDRQAIPESMVQGQDASEIMMARATLIAFSLVTYDGRVHTYEMHRLVQMVMRRWLQTSGTADEWSRKALLVVYQALLKVDISKINMSLFSACVVHAKAVLSHVQVELEKDTTKGDLQYLTARLLHLQGDYPGALGLCKQAVSIHHHALGLDHRVTLSSLNLAAVISQELGLDEAEHLFLQTLARRRRLFGETDGHTYDTLYNLATLFQRRGRLREAEHVLLYILRTDMDKRSTDVLNNLLRLGEVFTSQGRISQAVQTHKLFQTTRLKSAVRTEPIDPRVIEVESDLARDKSMMGCIAEAEEMYERALRRMEECYGAEHPQTTNILQAIGSFLAGVGRLQDAERFQSKALTIRQRVFGEDHLKTEESMRALAETYWRMDRFDKSDGLERKIWVQNQKKLDLESWDTLDLLEIDARTKDRLKAMLEEHFGFRSRHKQTVVTNARGLVIMIRGPHGVGKSVTVERISTCARQPALYVSASSLGDRPDAMKQSLRYYLHVGKDLGLVLVIADAHIFLMQDLYPDSLWGRFASVLIDFLERYEGVVILLSSETFSIPEAMVSRIHVLITLPTISSRNVLRIWETFLLHHQEGTRVSVSDAEKEKIREFLTVHEYERATTFTGRQIRDTFMSAISRAEIKSVDPGTDSDQASPALTLEHIQEAFAEQVDFNRYMREVLGLCPEATSTKEQQMDDDGVG